MRQNETPPIDEDRLEKAFLAREGGATLRGAAAAAGVHVATLCRWGLREPWIRDALADCLDYAKRKRYLDWLRQGRRQRPRVPWRKDCPACGSRVVVRTAEPGFRY